MPCACVKKGKPKCIRCKEAEHMGLPPSMSRVRRLRRVFVNSATRRGSSPGGYDIPLTMRPPTVGVRFGPGRS